MYAKDLIASAKIPPGSRKKPLFAVVRGAGGGKTRALTEITKSLLQNHHSDVLVLGITFNSEWSPKAEYDLWEGIQSCSKFYALSLVSRMVSVYFQAPLSKVSSLMKSSEAMMKLVLEIEAKEIILHSILWMTETIQSYRKDVNVFILLLDEVMRMEDFMKNYFPELDPTSIVREALLGQHFITQTDRIVNVALAISSLIVRPIGRTDSGRGIRAIELPSNLNNDLIVNEIWATTFSISRVLSDQEKYRLKLVAETINSVPRLVEMVNDFILMDNNKKRVVDKNFVADLFKFLPRAIQCRYIRELPPPDNILKAIIFKIPVLLNEPGLDAVIRASVITNSLTVFGENEQLEALEVSIVMLNYAIGGSGFENTPGVIEAIHRGLTTILNILSKDINQTSMTTIGTGNEEFVEKGQLIRTLCFEWMKIRVISG